jgi:hypothetical protein
MYGASVVHKLEEGVASRAAFVVQVPSRLHRIRGRAPEANVAEIKIGDRIIATGCIDASDLDLIPLDEKIQVGIPITVEFHAPEHSQRVTLLYLLEPLDDGGYHPCVAGVFRP